MKDEIYDRELNLHYIDVKIPISDILKMRWPDIGYLFIEENEKYTVHIYTDKGDYDFIKWISNLRTAYLVKITISPDILNEKREEYGQ